MNDEHTAVMHTGQRVRMLEDIGVVRNYDIDMLKLAIQVQGLL